jgi:carbon-monoxide dehydrogenase large subunit
MIPPAAMPFKTAVTFTYDSGEFEAAQAAALKLIDAGNFAARREAARTRGKLRGLGIAYAIERAAPPGLEYAELRFDATGTATVLSGTTSQGQGHVTTYVQVLCERLGLDPAKVRVYEGDTDRIAFGFGSGGSRSSAMGTAAVALAADKIIAKGKKIAAHALEAAETDITFADGAFRIAGTDRKLPFADMVKIAYDPARLPKDVEGGLYESATYRGELASYPNGCHACELEIDEETGAIQILRYVVVDDFGVLVNPLLVKGQVHGGVAQGLGQALMENFVYDGASGQAVTGSFMDYCMPRADDMSSFEIETRPTRTATNPLGVKGAGEAGTVGALPVVMNAVVDALAPLGVRHLDMPASPERVWQAIRRAKRS